MHPKVLLHSRQILSVRPSVCRSSFRQRLDVRAGILTATGPKFAAEAVSVKGTLGEGSYGQVFEGALSRNGTTERVVLKRVKTRVEGAEQMGQMELLLNVYASQKARGAIANFMGHIEVQPEESNYRLTPGLWLVWKYEGCRTLSYYLKRRDCLQVLARDLGVPEKAVVATVINQIFECLTALHNAGVVHRDVKPLNLILSEEEHRFKLIDLGAAADLRNGTNYAPDESILDPSYCPPEQYCLPTSAPHLGRQLAPLKLAISPLLWSRHKPDCFDSYSTGLVMMQLAVPKLRSTSALKTFNKSFQACKCDLDAWRERERLAPAQAALLDADDGAGWELAQALLRPRKLEVLDDGGVEFINESSGARLRVFAALKHRFVKQAAPPGLRLAGSIGWGGREGTHEKQARSKDSLTNAAVSIWKRATSKLFDLEAKIVTQAEALEEQTTKVQKLQDTIAERQGKSRAELEVQLAQEAGKASGMQAQLNSLTKDFTATSAAAQRTLKGLFGRRPAKPVVDVDGMPTARLRPGYGTGSTGGSRSDLPPSMRRLEPEEPDRAPVKKPKASREQRVEPVKAAPVQAVKAVRSQPAKAARGQPAKAPPPEEASSEPESKSAGKGAGSFLAGAAVNGLYTGLKFTGLAVRVASGLAASIGKDAEAAMARSRAAEQEQRLAAEQAESKQAPASRPTKRASMAFMEMLREARDPPVSVQTTWLEVAAQFEEDRRCEVIAEEQRQQMYDTFREALAKVEELKAQRRRERAAEDFKGLLRDLGMRAQTEWRGVEKQLRDLDLDVSDVLGQKERQRLFLEVRGELAAEQEFKALLESAADISASTSWPLAKRQIWADPRFDAVSEAKRKELFQEYIAVLDEVEAYNTANAAKQAVQERAAEAAEQAVSIGRLGTLQDEQARLKAEYDRMEAKLKEMEAKLKSKEAVIYESDGVAAKAARDRQGTFVFQFDKDRAASVGMNGSSNSKHRP